MSDVSAMFGAAASNDEKKGLEGGGGLGKFGLNQNARITKFEINTMAGKGQTPGLAVDINVTASGKEVRRRIFEPNKVYCTITKGSVVPTTDAHKEAFKKNMGQYTGMITHLVKATGVTQETINNALAVPAQNLKGWLDIMFALVPANFSERPVDVFLQWQKAIGSKAKITFLEIHDKRDHGVVIIPAVPGVFSEFRDEEGLRYVNATGDEHPIKRKSDFFETKHAEQQKEESTSTNMMTQATSYASNSNPSNVTEEWGGQ